MKGDAEVGGMELIRHKRDRWFRFGSDARRTYWHLAIVFDPARPVFGRTTWAGKQAARNPNAPAVWYQNTYMNITALHGRVNRRLWEYRIA